MTPSTLISVALANVGLGSTTDRDDRARYYMNQTAQEIYAWSVKLSGTNDFRPIQWLWAFKETTLSLSASTRSYSLAADVLEPYEYFDTTNDHWVPMSTISEVDHYDPDESETGDPWRIAVTGRDASTGYWTVDVYPTPDATTALRYRYYAQWVDLTSDDDDTDLKAVFPEWLQPALVEGTAEKYLREKADLESAEIRRRAKEQIINAAVARNAASMGRTPFRLQRPRYRQDGFYVQKGSLT